MIKLLKHLKEYTKETILGPLFKLMEATLELFVPLVVAAIIDSGIASRDTGYIVKMCLVLVALGAVGLALAVTAQYFSAKAAVGFVVKAMTMAPNTTNGLRSSRRSVRFRPFCT